MATLCQFNITGLCCVCITSGCVQATSVCGTHYGDGANLTNVAGTVPTGAIVLASTGIRCGGCNVPPTGFLCTNAVYSQSSYPCLYSCVGLVTQGSGRGYSFSNCCLCYACAFCARSEMTFVGDGGYTWTTRAPNWCWNNNNGSSGPGSVIGFTGSGVDFSCNDTQYCINVVNTMGLGCCACCSVKISKINSFGAAAPTVKCCHFLTYLPTRGGDFGYGSGYERGYGACNPCVHGPYLITDWKCRAIWFAGNQWCCINSPSTCTASNTIYPYLFTNNAGVTWAMCSSICCLSTTVAGALSTCTVYDASTCGGCTMCVFYKTQGLTWYDQKSDKFAHIPLVKILPSGYNAMTCVFNWNGTCVDLQSAGKCVLQSTDLTTWTAAAAALSRFDGYSYICVSCCCNFCGVQRDFSFIPASDSVISCYDPVTQCSYLYYPGNCGMFPGCGSDCFSGKYNFMSYDLATNCFVGWSHIKCVLTVFDGKLYTRGLQNGWCGVCSTCIIEYDLTSPSTSFKEIARANFNLSPEVFFRTRCIAGQMVGVFGGITTNGIDFKGGRFNSMSTCCNAHYAWTHNNILACCTPLLCGSCFIGGTTFLYTSSGCVMESPIITYPNCCGSYTCFNVTHCALGANTYQITCVYSLYDFNKSTNFRTPVVDDNEQLSTSWSGSLSPYIKS